MESASFSSEISSLSELITVIYLCPADETKHVVKCLFDEPFCLALSLFNINPPTESWDTHGREEREVHAEV